MLARAGVAPVVGNSAAAPDAQPSLTLREPAACESGAAVPQNAASPTSPLTAFLD